METTILGLYWGYIGIMEKKMESIVQLGISWGIYNEGLAPLHWDCVSGVLLAIHRGC